MKTCLPYAKATETFDLPPMLLADYPELDGLVYRNLRVTALAVYYDNRTMSKAFDTIDEGRAIRGLTAAAVGKLFDLIEARLRGLSGSCEAQLLAAFVADEVVLLEDTRRRAEHDRGVS